MVTNVPDLMITFAQVPYAAQYFDEAGAQVGTAILGFDNDDRLCLSITFQVDNTPEMHDLLIKKLEVAIKQLTNTLRQKPPVVSELEKKMLREFKEETE